MSTANKNEVPGLGDAFGAEEVEDWGPPVPPQGWLCSAQGEAPELQQPRGKSRAQPGVHPTDTAGTGKKKAAWGGCSKC